MQKMYMTHPIFPTPNIKRTAEFYVKNLEFNAVEYLNCAEPHICLYKDDIEIILTDSKGKSVITNREQYGYGYDAYIIVDNQEELQKEFDSKSLKIVKRLSVTDYNNKELVLEDVDGRWLGFGVKLDTKFKRRN
ncbi:MAG: glyoxalase [Oscillospiraceae bacterium]|nr:glyoxalase [Oscillospiraceae bacterium]